MHEKESELLKSAREGDPDALDGLLRQHAPQILRFGMKMCRNPEDARDVVQDTMLAVARSVRQFRGQSSLATWLFQIARSFCIKKRRRSKFAPAVEQSLESQDSQVHSQIPDPARSPEDAVVAKEIERAFARAIADLDPKYREVLILRDVEGLTAPEVAEILSIPVDTVKTRLHRARQAVRAVMLPVLEDLRPEPA